VLSTRRFREVCELTLFQQPTSTKIAGCNFLTSLAKALGENINEDVIRKGFTLCSDLSFEVRRHMSSLMYEIIELIPD